MLPDGQPLVPITIKWGFAGAVGALQAHLRDDATLESAPLWTFVASSGGKFDVFEAFSGDHELPMTGRAAIIVKRWLEASEVRPDYASRPREAGLCFLKPTQQHTEPTAARCSSCRKSCRARKTTVCCSTT